jgi:hypothetical protein
MTNPTPTTTPVDVELDEQTANDVARLKQLNDEIDERKKYADELKASLRDRLPAGHKYRYDGREVLDLAKPGKQFDQARAAAIIPQHLHAACSVVRFDADLAKKILPPALYAQCCTPKAPAVKPL